MTILNELKFVQGAVAKKELLPTLTHFKIEGKTIRSFNGSIALSSPINLDINCVPKAVPFVKAIQNCKETVSMSLTKAGRLSIKSGPFKAFIECLPDEDTPHAIPEGKEFDIDGESLLEAIKILEPFIGDDASRPWSTGVLVKNQSAYATNNVTLIEYWVGSQFPIICNIPRAAIKEMVRINEPPIKAQANEVSISFHYENGRWIRASLLDVGWPDLDRILETSSNPVPLNVKLYEGLETLKPFVDQQGRIYIHDGTMRTTLSEGEGASFELENFPYEGVYQITMLNLLQNVADKIDLSLYPKPCIFYGERLRGAIIGMRA